ncbi:MAG TPA: hypothetical protein VIN07_00665 [Flavipsychrobacter sp.]
MKPYTLLFVAAILICLMQVWGSHYFLTGDGAVHVYNSAMLKDQWLGLHQSFYSGFYTLNRQVDPNWFSHIIMAAFQIIFSGPAAEKLLLTAYIVVYATGFRKLIVLSDGNRYLAVAGMLLVLNHTLVKGFYNFNISIALGLWVACTWLMFLKKNTTRNYMLFLLLVFIAFFAHAIGLAYGILLCTILTIFRISGSDAVPTRLKGRLLIKKLFLLTIGILPCVILLWQYSTRHGQATVVAFHPERLEQSFMFLDYQTHTAGEDTWSRVIGYAVLSVFVLSMAISKLRGNMKLIHFEGVVVICIILIVYLFVPAEMGGGSMMDMRARQLVYVSVAVGVVNIPVRDGFAKLSGILLCVLLAVISFIRLPVIMRAGAAAHEYVSVTKEIRPYSTLLPLSFSHSGKNMDDSYIVDRNWLFQHAIGYAGAEKPLIIMDNYAANTGYFPFIWIPESNPYLNLSVSPGHEDQLPNVDIPHYELESGKTIDYIVTWCYAPEYRSTPHVDSLFMFIEKNYTVAATSCNSRAVLYERKRYK